MPPLYDEGDKAFLRLQLEIIKISNDQSIFAWVDNNIDGSCEKGLLADSPLSFVDSGDVMRGTPEDLFGERKTRPESALGRPNRSAVITKLDVAHQAP